MASIKGSKTEQNLLKAFAGESQARNRYTFFAKIAQKEGLEQIAALFLETAENEGQHAKQYFKHLEGGMVEITATYPAGKLGGTTAENLLAAAQGENQPERLWWLTRPSRSLRKDTATSLVRSSIWTDLITISDAYSHDCDCKSIRMKASRVMPRMPQWMSVYLLP